MTAPGPPTEHETGHVAAVRAASVWADTLIDKTGRNELLYCKDRGKILLGATVDADSDSTADGDPTAGVDAVAYAAHKRAEPVALARLLRGETVRLRQLFRDEVAYQAAAKTAESIRRRIKEYDEERGVRIGRLAYGFATWTDFRSTGDVPRRGRWRGRPASDLDPSIGPDAGSAITDAAAAAESGTASEAAAGGASDTEAAAGGATDTDHIGRREIRAPVLLRDIAVTRRPGRDDFELTADRDVEISPVLLHYLRSTFRVDIDPELITDLNDIVDDPDRVDEALAKLGGALVDVPDFHIVPGALVGTFHYAKLAMHQDLLDNADAFADNDLVAAMAGDLGAIERIRRPVGEVTMDQPDHTPAADEFLVLDADPSQNYVINAALAGRNLVVQGPPGTGKSQTISNIIATFAARGRTVLFVAEKRAAIDAVLGRLADAGLDELTLDLHVTAANRTKVYEQFRDAIESARTVEAVDYTRLHTRLERDRAALIEHDTAMHRPRPPWGMSVHTAQTALLGVAPEARSGVRLSRDAVDGLDVDRADRVRGALGELVAIGGLDQTRRGPWALAQFQSDTAAARAREAVDQIRGWLAELHQRAGGVAAALGFADPRTPAEASVMVAICARTAAVAARWRPEIYDQDLPRLIAAASRHSDGKLAGGDSLGWWQRRRLRRQASALRFGRRGAELAIELREVAAVAAEWWRISRVRPPTQPDLGGVISANDTTQALLVELGGLLAAGDLAARDWAALAQMMGELSGDPNGAHVVARMNRLDGELRAVGLGDLLRWLARVAPTWPAERRPRFVVEAFDAVWLQAIHDRMVLSDPHLASFDGAAHGAVADNFIATDHAHAEANRQRARRRVAERLTEVRTRHMEQDLYLSRELSKKRRLKPLRDLVRSAPDVLLAAKPCWAMSPLLVSQLLPAERLFDIVIFDEASQVQPAEAIPSVARARAAVIAGDSRQLPPTAFFEAAVDTEEDVERDLLTQDAESVLEAFNRALGRTLAHEYYLGWHYRSQDARLIAPSNAFFYDNRMVTFPGTAVASPIEFVLVDGAESKDGSSPQEVRRVVDLMIGHARRRPSESLGVITMGITHANRIEEALNIRLRTEPDAREWFDRAGPEPYFIKNLERVQGDERDAIILAIGYGKSRGRMMHRFGPLNIAGGERRLNVAITRAKRHMTVVAGFHPDDLDSSKLTADGARRLGDFLRYAAGDAVLPASTLRDTAALNPFEIQVRDRLRAVGIDVECQLGVAGYFIDFAAKHPTKPGRMVLAIEADGAAYHSAPTTRSRDRLRQEQLERIGWRFHRTWSTDWFRNPDREIARIRAAYEAAVYAADRADAIPADSTGSAEAAQTAAADRVVEPMTSEVGATVAMDPFAGAIARGRRRGPRPAASFGAPIADYSDEELLAIIEWITSDGLLRTDLELKQEARDELGFRRNGARIEQRLSDAIDEARARRTAS